MYNPPPVEGNLCCVTGFCGAGIGVFFAVAILSTFFSLETVCERGIGLLCSGSVLGLTGLVAGAWLGWLIERH